MPLKEKLLIQRIRRAAGRRGDKPGIGIGDDCAVLPIPRDHEALVTTDFSLEDVHFRRDWHPPDSVGHRCLARGLSDIAAMGGIPHAAFLSLALPVDATAELGRPVHCGIAEAGGTLWRSSGRRRHSPIAGGNSGRHRGAGIRTRREGDLAFRSASRRCCSM